MKLVSLALITLSTFLVYSCTPIRGCTETSADNYEINAEEDDGTCIPARDKIIGDYTYYGVYTDVFSGLELDSVGTMQLTEANLEENSFNANFDGALILQGSISQNDITITNRTYDMTTYSGTGSWVRPDTVDAVLNITLTNALFPAPQQFVFYCKKTE